MSMPEVSAAEISRNFGEWQDKAMTTPVVVTRHGKPRLVLLSADTYNAHWGDSDSPRLGGAADDGRRVLLNHMIEGFVALDGDLKIVTANHAFEDMMERSADELVGRPFQESFPRAQALLLDFLLRVMGTGELAELDLPSTIVPGRIYRIRAFPYLGGVGAVLQSRQEEHEARHIQNLLQAHVAAAEQLPGVSWARLSLRGAFEQVSSSFSRMVGLAGDELLGKTFVQLVKPISRATVGPAMETCIGEHEARSVDAVMFTQGLSEQAVTIVFAPIVEAEAVSGVHVAVVVRA